MSLINFGIDVMIKKFKAGFPLGDRIMQVWLIASAFFVF